MPKDSFPKLTCLMPSFGKNTTPRWSWVCRSYCTRKYPRKTCHHILLTIQRGCLQDFLRDKKRTYPQVRLADTLGCWWLKPQGKPPTRVPQACTAQLRLQLVLDQIRKEANPGRWNLVCDNCPAQCRDIHMSLKVLTLLLGHDGLI